MINTEMIGFDGAGSLDITFASELDSTLEGKAAKVSANKKVVVPADDDVIHGKIIKVGKDGASTVQIKGYVEFEYSTSTVPTAGYCKLVADASGGVKVDSTNGREYLVLSIDTANKIVGFIL